MKKILATLILTTLLVSGCSFTADDVITPNKIMQDAPSVYDPTIEQQERLISSFQSIDPTLDPQAAVWQSVKICENLQEGGSVESQLSYAKSITSTASDETAQRIISAVNDNGFCSPR